VTATTDVCVIGSGFGGGVAALRMAEAGQSVTILEMGHRWDSVINKQWDGHPDVKEFQQTNGDFSYWMDIFNVTAGANLLENAVYAVISGRGLGGGSLVYSGVELRAASDVFTSPWPAAISRQTLDPYYTKAETQLQVTQAGWDDCGMKDAAFAWAAGNVGVSVDPSPIIQNQNCGDMGWCNNGCLRGGKNTVDRMYIYPAEQKGANVITGAMVLDVRPASGGKWQVDYVKSSNSSQPNLTWSGTTTSIIANEVFICAGAVNSAAILLRSSGNLPGGAPPQTGKNLSRGGDGLIVGILPDNLPSSLNGLDMTYGIVDAVTCFHYWFNPPPGFGGNWQKFVLQPVRMLPMAAALTLDPAGMNNSTGNMATFGLGNKHWMQKYGSRMLTIGVMGIDGMDGQVSLMGGVPTVSFSNSQATLNLRAAALAGVKQIIEQGGGGTVLTTWEQYRANDGYTIHPLGSCRMSDSVATGVVDHTGTVFNPKGGVYNGLHVLDCSVLSTPIGVNTSLTTAAVAEFALAATLAS